MSGEFMDQLHTQQDVTTTKYVIEQIKRDDQDLWARKVLEHFILHWCWRSPTFILKTSLLQSPSILCDNDIGWGAQTHRVCNILTSTGGWLGSLVESSMSRWNWRKLILPPTFGIQNWINYKTTNWQYETDELNKQIEELIVGAALGIFLSESLWAVGINGSSFQWWSHMTSLIVTCQLVSISMSEDLTIHWTAI